VLVKYVAVDYLSFVDKSPISFVAEFIRAFEPESWSCYNSLTRYVIMIKNGKVIVLATGFPLSRKPWYPGSEARLIVCNEFKERRVKLKDRILLAIGSVSTRKIDEFKITGQKNERFHFRISTGSALLPHPLDNDKVIQCRNYLEIKWQSWIVPGLTVGPSKIVEIYQKYANIM